MRRAFIFLLLVSAIAAWVPAARAAMSSDSYQVPWDAWAVGGDEQGSSASYRIDDTLGEFAVGAGSSESFALKAGYRFGDEQPLGFSVAMAPLGSSSTTYTSLNVGSKIVSLDPGVTNPFVAGQLVALVENPGLDQLTAVAKVATVAGAMVVVDRFDGQHGLMSASPSNARMIGLDGGDIVFGAVSVSAGAIATGATSVFSSTASGYTLYVQSVADLQGGGHTYTAVADGAVTAGSEEYGMRTHGTTAQLEADTAIQTTPVSVQASSAPTGASDDRAAFLYKIAVATGTPGGSYGQSVYFTLTPNY